MVFPAENVAVSETMTVSAGSTVPVEGFEGDSYLMELVITPGSGTTKAGALVRVGGEHSVSVDYDLTTDALAINRGLSGENFSSASFSHVVTEERTDGKVVLHIYVDRCSLEAFSGNYTAAGAMLIFPDEQDTGAALYAEGGSCDFEVTITQASSIWS